VESTGTKLSGFLYCDGAEDKADCARFVETYASKAMPLVGSTLKATKADVCADMLGGC
jgi:hypothetical protein